MTAKLFLLLAKKKVGFVDIYAVLVANSASGHFVSVKFTVKSNGYKCPPFLVLLEAISLKVGNTVSVNCSARDMIITRK